MPFRDIVGHQQALTALRRALHVGRLPTGYLFVGPPHVGKTTLALAFAQAANCEQLINPNDPETLDACGECSSCRRIAAEIYPDLRVIRPRLRVKLPKKATEKQNKKGQEQDEQEQEVSEERPPAELIGELEDTLIDVELINELIAEAARTAVEARQRVYLISSAETMNPPAANRLLKTLEEPPANTTFALTTSRPSRLLPTIISRCQEIPLHPLPREGLVAALEAAYPEAVPEQREAAASLSAGAYGRARRAMEQPEVLQVRADLLSLAASLPQLQMWECPRVAESFLEMLRHWWVAEEPDEIGLALFRHARERVLRTKMKQVLEVLESWFRDLMVVRDDGQLNNPDWQQQLREAAATYPPAQAVRACQVLGGCRRDLDQNINLRLAAEALLIRLLVLRRETVSSR